MLVAASATYAVPFTTTSSGQPYVAPNARTGSVGDINLTAGAAGTILAGESLSITYGGAQISELVTPLVTITAAAVNAGAPVVFGGFPFYGTAGAITIAPYTVQINPTNIQIVFNAATAFAFPDSIVISHVRLNVVPVTGGSTVGSVLNATMASLFGSVTVTSSATAVATIANPIAMTTPAFTTFLAPPIQFSTGSVALANALGGFFTRMAKAEVIISEAGAFTNAFETLGGANPTQIVLTITGIPAGLTMIVNNLATSTNPLSPYIDGGLSSGAPLNVAVNYAACSQVLSAGGTSTATVVVSINAQSAVVSESVAVGIVFQSSGANLATGTGNITASLGPEATNLAGITVGPPAGTGVPFGPAVLNGPISYFNNPVPSIPFISVIQVTTELLATFNVYIPGAYNTGFSVANTTGFLGVTPQTDVITVTLQPQDGSAAVSFLTSATNKPGIGLNSSGQLVPGASWTVLLSDLLKTAGVSGSFEGFVRFSCNFTNAHGVNYIADSNFAVQAQGYSMLVIPSPRAKTNEGLAQ